MDNSFYLPRSAERTVLKRASFSPAVVLVGPRQVGKTSLVKAIRNQIGRPSLYLDLERPADLAKLENLESLTETHPDYLFILDEIQRKPDLFPELRSIIDRNREAGRFILLGSASPELIRDGSEPLAGRISIIELGGLVYQEVSEVVTVAEHWLRGGFPRALLTADSEESSIWREDFIRTYLERELPRLGLPAEPVTIRRLWTMLAHLNGQTINKTSLANSLQISVNTLSKYLDFLEHAYLIRRLPPYIANLGKRLVKSPKVYIKDSGLLHTLLGIETYPDLLGHPGLGASWEAYAIEQLVAAKPRWADHFFYRTQGGAEVDLVITRGGLPVAIVEFKHSVNPKLSRGFFQCAEDLGVDRRFIVAPVAEPFTNGKGITVLGIEHLSSVYVA